MKELDFTNCKLYPKAYGGANGNKKAIIFNNELYMLKFPPKPKQNNEISYINSCFSEYISCHILKTLGLNSQDTLLGKFDNKIAVACKDFTSDLLSKKYDFYDFASLKNSVMDSSSGGYDTELDEILKSIENQTQFDIKADEVKKHFWNMFIADTLLGNFDRHNGNWGFLVNAYSNECKVSPIFDCGSCLFAQISEEGFKKMLNDRSEIEKRVYVFPNSAIKISGVKINMLDFLKNTNNKDCLEALQTITPKIDLSKINEIIDNTPYISDNHKAFLKTIIEARKTLILDEVLNNKNLYCDMTKNIVKKILKTLKSKNQNLQTPILIGRCRLVGNKNLCEAQQR
ncbi:HipA domain-containing protein [Campylobacter gastrosuis]|uniref:HipA domain-containing protein n=1 Tax=Campylobacter gastrosuis TaxID=2974576 RepID=A0ABT7HPA5_9BACT|nr:HipA domain-containing protein [Campylobacter gastrosuis]MDL0088767.1 HipA domain-containing protein [Campylobacter gastrosuis]